MTLCLGPILHFRGYDDTGVRLAAVVARAVGDQPGVLMAGGITVMPQRLADIAGLTVWRYDFRLRSDDPVYHLEGGDYAVVTDLGGDMRLGFVACNGQEHGDLERPEADRNAMWDRLTQVHRDTPLALLLQGGDQIYADECTKGHPLCEDWPHSVPQDVTPDALEDLRAHLLCQFTRRYMAGLGGAAPSWIMARVPTLAMWDDHDICDGWGSLPESRTHSAVGQMIFEVARQTCLLFQFGATEADLPDLCTDPTGTSLGWAHHLPGVSLVAPDLRSERGLNNIMGVRGWAGINAFRPRPGHTFVVSTVPVLGPRLSLIEGLLTRLPGMQKYEDDLRDQWQSHAHRGEWQRMLHKILAWRGTGPVTILSGEIHLATRAVLGEGTKQIAQLVSSGITHPAPPASYARGLGWLAGLGASPLPDHNIRISPLPGQKRVYTAERNFLILERQAGQWSARWHLENTGATPRLPLD